MDIADVTIETFEGREGQKFSIQFEDGTLELTLVAVERMPEEWGRGETREPFSIMLEEPGGRLLPQATWPLDHDELGRLELFLVALEPEGDAARYQAIFT